MNKLLKSLLIATTSLGVITGSTAAVVACGETTPVKDSQEEYSDALNAIVKHFTNNALFVVTSAQIGDGTNTGASAIKPFVQQNVLAYIQSTDSDMLTAAQKATIKANLTATDIVVEINGTLDTGWGDHTTVETTKNITITVPTIESVKSTPKALTGVKYTVSLPPYQQAYEDQSKQVLDNIGTVAKPIMLTYMDTQATIKGLIVDAINTYITNNSASLTAIKVITADQIPDTGIDTSIKTDNGTHNVNITILKANGSQAVEKSFSKLLNYIIPTDQKIYNDLANQISSGEFIMSTGQLKGAIPEFIYDFDWTIDHLNGDQHALFLEAIRNCFGIYYASLSGELKSKMELIFGTDVILVDCEATLNISAHTEYLAAKLKFTSAKPEAQATMSTSFITFKQTPHQ